MIIEPFKGIKIDTDWDYVKAEKTFSSSFCSRNSPKVTFTIQVNNYRNFISMHYNKDGSVMQKITSWYQIPQSERMHKVLKSKAREGCYFSKQEQENEKEWVTEVDYSKNSFSDTLTHWKRGMFEKRELPSTSGVISETYKGALPIQTKERKKKYFGIF